MNIKDIVDSTRQTGNTTWILKVAINNPNCAIVSKNPRYLEDMYFKLFYDLPWYKRLYHKLFIKKHPMFITKEYNFYGIKVPVIFDNSALT